MDERLASSSQTNPKFGTCCYSGKISLPMLHPVPPELYNLLSDPDPRGRAFHEKIRNYNNALAMTSVGRQLDHTLNNGGGPWIFKLYGELTHRIGSLLPSPDSIPSYAQLYIYDTEQALQYRMNHPLNSRLDQATLQELQDMLYRAHPAVQLYRQAHELTAHLPLEQHRTISLHFDENCDRRRYNVPEASVNEIAVILPGDGDQIRHSQDIILHYKDGPLRRISDLHPLYPALRYVLLFPTGQLGWHDHLAYEDGEDGPPDDGRLQHKRKYISMAEFHHFRLHIRPLLTESQHLFLSGKLFQEYVCETWAVTEQNRLNYIKQNQDKLRVEVYQGLADAVAANADTDWNQLGRRFILPSSFTGSTRNMQQHLQDALAINRYYGGGDLFITMTANPEWPEIKSALLPGQQRTDRPDLVIRVFHAKLQSLIQDIRNDKLGAWAAHLYTIEFQKRGLPHAHIIVFLKPQAKLRTPEDIDSLMSSEFPATNSTLFDQVKTFMVHRPCGAQNPHSPCMVDGVCSKGFPKPFREETSMTEDSYARTRRPNTGQSHQVKIGRQHVLVNNQWIVCHSPYLLWKYRCHINVESIASVKAVKYIYKYVYKGHDRTTMQFGRCQDEVKQYLDARYVSSCEALWRLYLFHMQEQVPNVVRLQVHLRNQQRITFNPDGNGNVQEVVNAHADRPTTLTGWFNANAQEPAGSEILGLLYQDYPSKMVWHDEKENSRWTHRERGFAIGRMYYAHPTSGERFYLRLLLTCVRGATDWKDLYSFEGIEYPTFKQACIVRGLLEDDQEWSQCLEEARHMQTGVQLRHLFVTIIRDCTPADPRALWDTFWPHICDDLSYQLQHHAQIPEPSQEQIQDYGLYLIDKLLSHTGKRLKDWDTMPQFDENWGALLGNDLIQEQHQYDQVEQAQLAAQHIGNLNPDQHTAFDKITSAIINKTGEIFFLHGPGGTGKTYLYNTLCYHLRSQGKIVLCVASSGIAALLLKGGRTAHSRFKIPIPCHESSVCNIAKHSDLAELIRMTDLVVWDEAPMQHRHIMDTVDRSFRDICNSDKPFGGHTFVFGGDFQQILPVIVHGSRAQIVGGCIQRSVLWRSITILHLHQNMHLNTHIQAEAEFARWQLEVGQGKHTDPQSNISLPAYFKCRENTVRSLIDTIYPGLNTPNHPFQYFAERSILSSLNSDVDSLNRMALEDFPGPVQLFHSADSIPPSEQSGEDDPMLNYPVEYLNEINCTGLPLAKLEVKIGCPVMILKNLDPANGVCNGSRGILRRYGHRVMEVELITGDHAGHKVFIPRISNYPTEEQVAFKFCRRQFPVRLSFAMTINKSQGQTVKHVGLDLRRPVFTHGQFYVGISRVTSKFNIKAIWEAEKVEAKTKNIVYPEVLL